MPLTREQFQKARSAGYTPEQIIGFEKRRESESIPASKPEPMFSSMKEAKTGQETAQRDLRKAQFGATPFGVLSKAVSNTVDPMVNSAAFGLPDIVSKKMTGKPFVSEDAQMKWLSEPAGMVAGGAGQLGLKAAGKILPVVEGGLRMSAKGIPQVIKDTMMRKVGRGAIAGGVAGATQLASDEEGNIDVGRQALQGVGGAAVGGALIPIPAFISKAGNAYKKWNRGAKTPVIKKLTDKVNRVKQGITLNTAERNASQRQLTEQFDADLAQTKDVLKTNFDNLSREFQESAETGAMNLQESAKFVSNEMSDSYGEQLGNIAEDLISSGNQIKNSEISSLISSTRSKLQDNLITSGHVVDVLNKMESKYGQKFISNPSKFFSGQTGIRANTLRSNVDDVVDFKKFVKDIKDVKKGIKFGGKTEDNVALGIFYDDLTGYLGQRPGLEKYLELNQTYAPYLQSLKTLTQQTKAYAGESQTQQATNLLKRFGLRKADVPPGQGMAGASPAEGSVVRNIERLQEPSPFSKGMGTNATDPVVMKAQQLSQARQSIQDIDGIVAAGKKKASQAVDNKFMNELDSIMGSNKYVESDYVLKEKMIQDALASKLKRMGYQQDKINIIKQDREKVKRMLKFIAGGTASVGGVLTVANAIGRASR